MEFVQRVNDALLEADAWRQTAARWRKRALREGAPWRRKAAKLEEELDGVNERAAELQEKVDELESELEQKDRPLRGELDLAKKEVEQLHERARRAEADVAKFRAKIGKEGSIESVIVERDFLRDALERVKKYETEARDACRAEREAREKMTMEVLNPARARIRVLATRLGISPSSAAWKDDDLLTAELDRRIFDLQTK